MTELEENFSDDVEEMRSAVEQALDELSQVRAYTLTLEELKDFKAAQYALRNIARQHYDEDVASLYETDVEVTANEKSLIDQKK